VIHDDVVVDASAAAAILFREPDSVRIAPRLFRASRAVVPQLFHLEVANVGRTKVHRRELEESEAVELLAALESWPLEVEPVAWRDVWTTAFASGLTVYDAAYLHLAARRRLPLLSLDGALVAAAGKRDRKG
jgi:predicted nucleic acid-binding protein